MQIPAVDAGEPQPVHQVTIVGDEIVEARVASAGIAQLEPEASIRHTTGFA